MGNSHKRYLDFENLIRNGEVFCFINIFIIKIEYYEKENCKINGIRFTKNC
jgi:hypothetical protein